MKLLCISSALLLTSLCASANNIERQYFFNNYAGLAIDEMMRSGIPASLTLAQAALESNWGKGKIALEGKNFFGIKCHNGWAGQCLQEQDDEVLPSSFRIYSSVEESFRDHSEFLLSNPRYKPLFQLPATDYRQWAYGLKECGYATDEQYAEKLIRIIEENNLALHDLSLPVANFKVLSSEPVFTEAETETELADGEESQPVLKTINPASFRVLDTPVVLEDETEAETKHTRTAPAYHLGEFSGNAADGDIFIPRGVLGWGAPLSSTYW
ncbi:MAG: Exo-glucosaminidase LytG precursor [Bacteroidota bacterium]|jgi:hypothetical protein